MLRTGARLLFFVATLYYILRTGARLLENVRVRRAGYAYRQPYAPFLQRYKMLSRRTWPAWPGPAREGVAELFGALFIDRDEYAFGVTKVFIRNPRTVRKAVRYVEQTAAKI